MPHRTAPPPDNLPLEPDVTVAPLNERERRLRELQRQWAEALFDLWLEQLRELERPEDDDH